MSKSQIKPAGEPNDAPFSVLRPPPERTSPTGRNGDPVYEPYIRNVDLWTLRCNSFAFLCEIVLRRA